MYDEEEVDEGAFTNSRTIAPVGISSTSSPSVTTLPSQISYKEAEHARLRRQQCGIDKNDLKSSDSIWESMG